jgi:hypothetical protein
MVECAVSGFQQASGLDLLLPAEGVDNTAMDGARRHLAVTSQLALNTPSIVAGSLSDQGAERFRKGALTLEADLVSDSSDRQLRVAQEHNGSRQSAAPAVGFPGHTRGRAKMSAQ